MARWGTPHPAARPGRACQRRWTQISKRTEDLSSPGIVCGLLPECTVICSSRFSKQLTACVEWKRQSAGLLFYQELESTQESTHSLVPHVWPRMQHRHRPEVLPCLACTLPDPGLHQRRCWSRRLPYFKYGLRIWNAGEEAAQPAPARRPNPGLGANPGGRVPRAGPSPALGKRARATELAECAGAAGHASDQGASRGPVRVGAAPAAGPHGSKRARPDDPRVGAPPLAKQAKVGDRGARDATPKSRRPSQELWRPITRTAVGAHGALAPGSQSPERLLGARARAGGAGHGARVSPGPASGRAAGSAVVALRDGQRVSTTQEGRACGVSGGGGSTSGVEVHVRAGRPPGASASGGSPSRSPSPIARTPGRAAGLTGACGVPRTAAEHVSEGRAWGVPLPGGSAPGSPATAGGRLSQSSPTLARAGDGALHGRGEAGSAGAAADLARVAGGFAEGLAAAGSAALLEALAQRLVSSAAFRDVIVARLGANDAAARDIVERWWRGRALRLWRRLQRRMPVRTPLWCGWRPTTGPRAALWSAGGRQRWGVRGRLLQRRTPVRTPLWRGWRPTTRPRAG